ncbi:hypothetical protein BU16DRAFT_527293 [Lophium mytilinum]|uniref:Uncharacterized protein n=1 Tax=Lophium mytilinum TaxID=390894 RepID=A0A6A6QTM6_9PEZI|nr:hypothetical protein BU16DRAFT_527293 [Lophium mytilinum]
MSGYDKYACTYRCDYQCPNFVWRNGDACAYCQAIGHRSNPPRETVIEKEMVGPDGRPHPNNPVTRGYNSYHCINRLESDCTNMVRRRDDICARCIVDGRPSRR